MYLHFAWPVTWEHVEFSACDIKSDFGIFTIHLHSKATATKIKQEVMTQLFIVNTITQEIFSRVRNRISEKQHVVTASSECSKKYVLVHGFCFWLKSWNEIHYTWLYYEPTIVSKCLKTFVYFCDTAKACKSPISLKLERCIQMSF